MARQAFDALLDSAALMGKFHADPSPVNPSSSIPQIARILLKGFNHLQPFLEDERDYLDLFTRDVRALDCDIYIDSLRGAVLAYVRLQRGLDQTEELKTLRGQITRLTEEVSAAVKEASKDVEIHRV